MESNRTRTAPHAEGGEQTASASADAKLLALRAKIVASGRRLLDWDEVEREVAERRGGVGDAATS